MRKLMRKVRWSHLLWIMGVMMLVGAFVHKYEFYMLPFSLLFFYLASKEEF